MVLIIGLGGCRSREFAWFIFLFLVAGGGSAAVRKALHDICGVGCQYLAGWREYVRTIYQSCSETCVIEYLAEYIYNVKSRSRSEYIIVFLLGGIYTGSR